MSLLAVNDVHKRYSKLEVLRGASLTVEPGQIVGLTGENGSGKSTLLRIAVGLAKPDQGRITLGGTRGYCPQEPVLFESLTMHENVDYFASGYGLAGDQTRAHAQALMERLHCARHASKRVATLSGGTGQKLNLIVSLLHEPDLLILDEPYQGFDYESYIAFWDLAEDLKRQGKGALIVSHMIIDRERLDRLYTLRDGRAEVE